MTLPNIQLYFAGTLRRGVKMSKLIAITTGGTGGHVFPAYALAEELTERGHKVFFITDDRCETNFGYLLKNYDYEVVPAATPTGSFKNKIKSAIKIARGVMKAGSILYDKRPDVVVGFGGYPSFPAMFAATNRNIPTIMHEQNAYMGKTNLYFAEKVDAIATSFHRVSNLSYDLRRKVTNIGNPVRKEILALRHRRYRYPRDDETINLLILGGSQGASVFKEVITEVIPLLLPEIRERLYITQQCRPGEEDIITKFYKEANIPHEVAPFFYNVPELLANAHVLFARAGASTVAEATIVGIPTIYVPYPHAAEDHQTKNALAIAEMDGGWIFSEDEFNMPTMLKFCNELLVSPHALDETSIRAKRLARPNAVQDLADLVLDAPRIHALGGLKAIKDAEFAEREAEKAKAEKEKEEAEALEKKQQDEKAASKAQETETDNSKTEKEDNNA